MCPSDHGLLAVDMAPKHQLGLFDNEADSDVTFLVGGYDRWRFPGHRSVLAQANPVFRAMFQHNPDQETIVITDVDGRAFDLLLRYLYKEDVKIQSVNTALCTLYAAQKYLSSGLVGICVSYLDRHTEISNALEIFHTMRIHCGQVNCPTAPPYHHIASDPDPNDNSETMLSLCTNLLHNCCYFIDINADKVLAQESVEDVPVDCLKELLERDSLCVSSELVVYNALERWANRECKRCQLQLSPESRRSVVPEDLLFTCRYLRMSQPEFYSGPMSGSLLTQQEVTVLLGIIMNVPNGNTAPTLTDQVKERISRRREFPVPPSSLPQSSSNSKASAKKKTKKKKKEKSPSSSTSKCTGSCALDYVVRGLACLFD